MWSENQSSQYAVIVLRHDDTNGWLATAIRTEPDCPACS